VAGRGATGDIIHRAHDVFNSPPRRGSRGRGGAHSPDPDVALPAMTHAALSCSAQALVCMPARGKIMRFFITLGVQFAAVPASARTFVVRPGHSVQADVNRGRAL